MMPDNRYYKVVFDNGSEMDVFYSKDMLKTISTYAEQHSTKITYYLQGQDQYAWPYEFVPLKYFNPDGTEAPEKLLAVQLERGLKSSNPYAVAAASMIVKHIQEEIKK